MHRSNEAMIWIGNLKKRLSISVAKAKYFVVLPLSYVLESHALLYGNIFMTLYSVDSDEAMKR
jgi:hypothetical protein